MNRKTNVFYLNGNDSKFLTFDNYTDALTGDIIATNKKLWPSRFLCANIEYLSDTSDFNKDGSIDLSQLTQQQIENLKTEHLSKKKTEFIKEYLVKYYENKLAFLRDNLDEKTEMNLVPLTYLLEIIIFYSATKGKNLNIETIEDLEKNIYNHYRTDSTDLMDFIKNTYGVDFCYIGDIVEQDYNGTYADIICTITPNKRKMPKFILDREMFTEILDEENDNEYTGVSIDRDYDNDGSLDILAYGDENILFGWNSNTDQEFVYDYFNDGNEEPSTGLNLIFDIIHNNTEETKKGYFIKPIIKTINPLDNPNSLKFNVIIPLFDMEDISGVDIDDDDENASTLETSNMITISKTKSVPLGIYFSDKPMVLDNDVNGYSSNWSLLISTQFKPFPYSYNITHSFDDSDSIKDAYITFAEILANQTNFIDLLNKYNDTIIGMSNRISILESIINSISSVQNIDELSQSFITLKNDVYNKIKNLQDQIDLLKESIEANKLKWKIKNNE